MLDRRTFMKAGAVTALGVGLNLYSPQIFRRKVLAGPSGGPKKMIFIFQRGGNDAANTVIPRGDAEYSVSNRPTLFIPDTAAIDLGNGFAQLHPALQPLMEIYNHSTLNGIPGPGNLAVLHRIGYDGQSKSHFSSQQYWENGTPGQALDEGMIYRQVEATMNPQQNAFTAAAISDNQMRALRGAFPLPAFDDAQDFVFSGNQSSVDKFIGQLPTASLGTDGKGLLGLYDGPRELVNNPFGDLVYNTGLSLVESIDIVQGALQQGSYMPENGAVYPSNGFGSRLEQIAMLLKRTPVQVLGVDIDGWDTHSNQGGQNGRHADLLGDLALGIQALSRDLQSQWSDLVIVTMTEFGRTSIENGSSGTDHAHATSMFVAGGGVNGGVYNCDPTTWLSGDLLSYDNKYIRRKTDYRSVFAEIFMNHFGDDLALVNQVIPGFDAAALANPTDFAPLNFI